MNTEDRRAPQRKSLRVRSGGMDGHGNPFERFIVLRPGDDGYDDEYERCVRDYEEFEEPMPYAEVE